MRGTGRNGPRPYTRAAPESNPAADGRLASGKASVAGVGNEPRHDLRAFVDRTQPARTPAVPGLHVGLEQEIVRIALVCPQPRYPLGWLGVAHLAVVEASGDEQRRIVGPGDVVVGRVGQHVFELALDCGITPLV